MDQNHYSSVLPDPGFLIRLRKQEYLKQVAKDQQVLKSRPQYSVRQIHLVSCFELNLEHNILKRIQCAS